jgi:uncharacterized protein (TIGR02453 family)
MFRGFPKEGLSFLEEIAQNNTKEWFEANKSRYKKLILEPNVAYIHEMGEHLQILSPNIVATPKVGASLFRIYRDTRFSNNKAPIKTTIGILFYKGNDHRMQCPAFYMHYSVDEVFLATGIRSFKPPLLKKYREYIKDPKNAASLDQVLQKIQQIAPTAQSHYKRVPAGFDKEDALSYLTLYNGIYAYKSMPPSGRFFSEDFVYDAYAFYEQTFALFAWLYELVES